MGFFHGFRDKVQIGDRSLHFCSYSIDRCKTGLLALIHVHASSPPRVGVYITGHVGSRKLTPFSAVGELRSCGSQE